MSNFEITKSVYENITDLNVLNDFEKRCFCLHKMDRAITTGSDIGFITQKYFTTYFLFVKKLDHDGIETYRSILNRYNHLPEVEDISVAKVCRECRGKGCDECDSSGWVLDYTEVNEDVRDELVELLMKEYDDLLSDNTLLLEQISTSIVNARDLASTKPLFEEEEDDVC